MKKYFKINNILIAAVIAFVPARVFASDLNGESRTYFKAGEDFDGNKINSLYEYLDFDAYDLRGREDVSFHFSGWARRDLARESFNSKKSDGDVQYAYFTLLKNKGNARLDLGRILVIDGIAFENIDGAYMKKNGKHGFALSVYGGKPVETGFDTRKNDYIYGSRFSCESLDKYNLGISYLDERNAGSEFREEAGIDSWVLPARAFEISGKSVYDLLRSVWKTHEYFALIGLYRNINLSLNSSWTNYGYSVTSLNTNAFRSVDTDEKLLVLGGQVECSLNNRFSVFGDYQNYEYELTGKARYYGAGAKYSKTGSYGTGMDLHRMEGSAEDLRYFESRLYAYKNFRKLDISMDLLNVNYDKRINNVKNSFSVTGSAGRRIRHDVLVGADIEYSHDPNFNENVTGLLKLVYAFGGGPAESEKP